MICTNSKDFFEYLQRKGVFVFLYEEPQDFGGILNVFFPATHNITVCGNAHNKQRIESGEMKKEFQRMHDLISCKNTIVITPITMFNGKIHNELYPESVLDVSRQRIHTSKLGELLYPHFIHIYGAELEPITDIEPMRDVVYYGIDKNCHPLDWNVFYNKCSKEERRKKRKLPEYALYSQLYKQVIKRGDYNA